MTGKMRRKTMANSVHLMWGRNDGVTLKTIKWSCASVQAELVKMLQRANLAPMDMVRAWDRSGNGSFEKREFLVRAPPSNPMLGHEHGTQAH